MRNKTWTLGLGLQDLLEICAWNRQTCADNDHAQHSMAIFKQCGRGVLRRKQFIVSGDLWEEGT